LRTQIINTHRGTEPDLIARSDQLLVLQNGYRSLGIILGIISEHMRQHLGVEDAAGRRDEGAEVLLAVERVAEANALAGEMRSGNAWGIDQQ